MRSRRRHRFPTFVSPYERPMGGKGVGGGASSSSTSNRGMSIPLVYCDQTASQRPVKSIEDYLRRISMPCHANTHTVSFFAMGVLFSWLLFFLAFLVDDGGDEGDCMQLVIYIYFFQIAANAM